MEKEGLFYIFFKKKLATNLKCYIHCRNLCIYVLLNYFYNFIFKTIKYSWGNKNSLITFLIITMKFSWKSFVKKEHLLIYLFDVSYFYRFLSIYSIFTKIYIKNYYNMNIMLNNFCANRSKADTAILKFF